VSAATGGAGGTSSGGSAGTTSGGTGGTTGGTGGTGGVTVVCTPGLIDDMEQDLGGLLPPCEGRSGNWYTFNDSLCPNQYPAPGITPFPYSTPGSSGTGHCVSSYGTCGTGTGAYGAALAFNLVYDSASGGNLAYDAAGRGYTGIRFNARTDNAGTVLVTMPDIHSSPQGNYCTSCYDDYGTTLTLSGTWATYTIQWTQLTNGGWGVPASTFVPNGIYAIQFRSSPGTTFSFYIDDIRFMP
jgi:hypothetical protein